MSGDFLENPSTNQVFDTTNQVFAKVNMFFIFASVNVRIRTLSSSMPIRIRKGKFLKTLPFAIFVKLLATGCFFLKKWNLNCIIIGNFGYFAGNCHNWCWILGSFNFIHYFFRLAFRGARSRDYGYLLFQWQFFLFFKMAVHFNLYFLQSQWIQFIVVFFWLYEWPSCTAVFPLEFDSVIWTCFWNVWYLLLLW